MAIVIGGVAIGAWELAALAAAAVTAAFLATPQGQEATRQTAEGIADAIDDIANAVDDLTSSGSKTDPIPVPVPLPRVKEDCPKKKKKCPPCVPPVGTISFEVHRVPPSKPHWPCPGDHVHFFQQMQNPINCQCFKKRNAHPVKCLSSGESYNPSSGYVPL